MLNWNFRTIFESYDKTCESTDWRFVSDPNVIQTKRHKTEWFCDANS